MQIISNLWYAEAEREGGMGAGAHVAHTCFAFLSEEEKKAFLEILQSEKAHGMDY